MIAVFKREFRSYMKSMYGYLFIALLLLFSGAMLFTYNLMGRGADIASSMTYVGSSLLVLIPLLSMRSMAEDKHLKMDMFLLSLPIKPMAVILGKYLAMLAVYAIPMGIMCLYPLILGMYGSLNYGHAYLVLLGLFLLGAALLAVGQFVSSLTENQVISAISGIGTMLLLYFLSTIAYLLPISALCSFICLVVMAVLLALVAFWMTRNLNIALVTAAVLIVPVSLLYTFFSKYFAGVIQVILYLCSPFVSFSTFAGGTLDLSCIVQLLSYVVFFVFLTFLTHRITDRKRWG